MTAGSSFEMELGDAADVATPPAGKNRLGIDTTNGLFLKDSDGVITYLSLAAMHFKGVIDCSANPNYPAGKAGDVWRISVAGKIGGASGVNVEVGDLALALVDNAGGTQAAVGASWSVEQANIDGAVIGPTSVTDDLPAVFDGTTGKLIKQKTYAAFKALLALVKGDVGLGNVDNTSDANKPVSSAQQTALDLKAPLVSPAFTGNPTAPTPAAGDQDTSLATTGFVATAVDPDALTSGEYTYRRRFLNAQNISMTSQTIRLSFFTARKSGTYTQLRCSSGTSGQTLATIVKFAIFSVAGDGTLTCIGVTANDTTLLATGGTEYTKGTTASFDLVAGQRYAFGVLVVTAGTLATLVGNVLFIASIAGRAPMLAGQVLGQSDMPAINGTIASGSVAASSNSPYGEVVT